MARTHPKRRPGDPKRKYSAVSLQRAVQFLKSNPSASRRSVAVRFGVPKSTLFDKAKGAHPEKVGRPTALSEENEKVLAECLVICGEWGMPLTPVDICDVVETFVKKTNLKVKKFNNNRPGMDWVESFLERNPVLSKRLSENIKRKRAEVSPGTINKYFDNLEAESYSEIPDANKINYDETNFCDDPGQKIVLVRRGTKHPENILDSSKSSTSVMFAVTGSGVVLPPYVVYKSVHLYDTWTEGGPPNTRFNRTESGWFDMKTFTDWFFTVCLPYFKTLPGEKAMTGDNLASHLSVEVIKACTENNIKFLLLPPNSTHLTQPLDVAFFRPLKVAWRKELDEHKKRNRGVLAKAEFPRRLANTLTRIEANSASNIKAGFKACGLLPLDRMEVLKRLPNYEPQPANQENVWREVLVENLRANRFPESEKKNPTKSRLAVEPGKSVEYGSVPVIQPKKKKSRKKKTVEEEEAEEDDVVPPPPPPVLSKKKKSSKKTKKPKEDKNNTREEDKENNPGPSNVICEKDFVLVIVDGKCYVGLVVDISESENPYEVTFMRKKYGRVGLYFVYPDVPHVLNVSKWSILRKLDLIEVEERKPHFFIIGKFFQFKLI